MVDDDRNNHDNEDDDVPTRTMNIELAFKNSDMWSWIVKEMVEI
jgi:hypothetical protein